MSTAPLNGNIAHHALANLRQLTTFCNAPSLIELNIGLHIMNLS